MNRRTTVWLVAGLLTILAVACASGGGPDGAAGRLPAVRGVTPSPVASAPTAPAGRTASPEPPGRPGSATVRGHVSWPDCSSGCPPLAGVPIHFADAAANQTLTATSDGSGGYVIQLPAAAYIVIAGNADRSQYQRQITVRNGDVLTLDLRIAYPTGNG